MYRTCVSFFAKRKDQFVSFLLWLDIVQSGLGVVLLL